MKLFSCEYHDHSIHKADFSKVLLFDFDVYYLMLNKNVTLLCVGEISQATKRLTETGWILQNPSLPLPISDR